MSAVDDTPDSATAPRAPSRGAIALARRQARRWMTGSLAVVMASLASHAAATSIDRRGLARLSPFGVQETVRRIEQAAQAQGLPVLARIDRSAQGGDPHWVIVLASSEGGTPVQVGQGDAPPEVPMVVHVAVGPDGAAWVTLPAADVGIPAESEWPDSVVDELAGLPLLVEAALH